MKQQMQGITFFAAAMCAAALQAGTSCLDGVAKAVPVKNGRAPTVDGDLSDWDKSGVVLCWNAEEFADRQNAALYFMYDDANLYFAAEMALHDHDITNVNRPEDRYWQGDLVQLRLSTDKSLPYPLPRKDRRNRQSFYVGNPRVTCVNMWRNTMSGEDCLFITPGAFFDCPKTLNPKGSAFRIVPGEKSFVMEARIPWSCLGVEDGKCPFRSGERMTAIVDVKWAPGSDGHFTAAIFNRDPGAFAFLNVDTWGQIEFSPKGDLPPPRMTFASVAAAAKKAGESDTSGWAKIAFDLPRRAKVSVNVFDDKGGVVRELIGGELREAGRVEVAWDGRDALGFPCRAGTEYRWGAYANDGLDVEYFGTVGTSGEPPYETKDRKGGWGGDHGPPVACAADDTGRYFVWHMNESGRGIVKTDFAGKVLWRTMPFVVDGWGNYSCIAADGRKVFLVYEKRDAKKPVFALVRLDASTGNYENFPDGRGFIPLEMDPAPPALPPKSAVRPRYAFNCVGIALAGGKAYISDFNGSRITVHDCATGLKTGEFACERPRGLCFAGGALYAVSGDGVAKIDLESSRVSRIVSQGISAPHGLAVAPNGEIFVSDLGDSQQVKVFSKDGVFLRAYGAKGGRGFLGRIDFGAFLYPFGLAVDRTGALLVAEASAPKIVSVLDAATGRTIRRHFGYTSYSPSNVPDPDDPLLQYYSLSGPSSFARARVPDGGGTGAPDASWDFAGAGLAEFGSVMNTMNMPEVLRCVDGGKYIVPDGTPDNRDPERPMTICRIDGDAMVPVAGVYFRPPPRRGAQETARLWMDANGDGRRQDGEHVDLRAPAGRDWRWAHQLGAMHMEANGDLFLLTMDNAVLCVPCRGFAQGVPQWDAGAVRIAIPAIVPGLDRLFCTYRQGLMDLRRDSKGNYYASVACNPEYATPEFTKYMHRGMGHTADVGAVFVMKYAPDGSLVWRVGRKAVGGMRPGEILHHWCHAGMVGDGYTVAASEWGVFTVYTADGFYVDRLFDVPGLPGRGVPYSFGGEDFSGRIQWFPARGEVWAYNAGHAYRVSGFESDARGVRVKGEWRVSGRVKLEKVQPLVFPGAVPKPLEDARIAREGEMVVFTAHVRDDTPLVNVAADLNSVFKGGDAVGFETGPAKKPAALPERNPKGRNVGFTRILAARVGGMDRVVAMKPFTDGLKKPQEYATPAGGTAAFEFVGEVPGAKAELVPDADGKGYSARVAVPAAFLELDFAKPVFWEAEALFSGIGGRGVGTVRRVYLHSPESSQTSMTDDTPTEARLYPAGWIGWTTDR